MRTSIIGFKFYCWNCSVSVWISKLYSGSIFGIVWTLGSIFLGCYFYLHQRQWCRFMSRRRLHFSQSVSGALKHWTKDQWETVAQENNTTAERLMEKFRIMEFEGKKLIPMNGIYCEGYSFENGCPGHEAKDQS